MCSDANAAKEEERKKGSEVFKETTIEYDIPSRHVCAMTSFEGFARFQPILRSVARWQSSAILLTEWD